MKNKKTTKVILGIHISNRNKHADKIQKLLSKYGCDIKTRIGFHCTEDKKCIPYGLIILELFSTASDDLEKALTKLSDVNVKKMSFSI